MGDLKGGVKSRLDSPDFRAGVAYTGFAVGEVATVDEKVNRV